MITREQVNRRVAEFVSACGDQGIKATHQRLEILRELAGTEAHPDAETVYAGVSRRISPISLDTVYRTLRLFEEKGIISRWVRRGTGRGLMRIRTATTISSARSTA